MTNFLHELFARFDVSNAIVFVNGIQHVSFEFKKLCKTFAVELVTTAPYNSRSNEQARRFTYTFQRIPRKLNKEVMEELARQQYLIPNPNTPSKYVPDELMFARKIKPVSDKLPLSKKIEISMINTARVFKIRENVFIKSYKNGKQSWNESVITKHKGKILYIVKESEGVYKVHLTKKEEIL